MGKVHIDQVSGYLDRIEGPVQVEGLRFTAASNRGEIFTHERAGTGMVSRAVGAAVVRSRAFVHDAMNGAIFQDPRERD